MKKKTIIILSIVLMISIIVSITTVTFTHADNSDADKVVVLPEPMFDITKVNEKASSTKNVTENNIEKQITYKDTFYYSAEQYVDQYYDEIGTRYAYNADGKQTEYTISPNKSNEILFDLDTGKAIAKSKEDITAIANSKMREVVGSASSEYVLNYYNYSDDTRMYAFGFNKIYGDFITGEGFNIYIYETGEIYYWSNMHTEILSDFDNSRLEGVTKEKLEKYGCYQTAAKYDMDVNELEAVGFQLVKTNGYYAVRIFIGNKNIEGSIVDSDVYYEV